MLTGDQREHWHGGEHRPGPGFPPSAPRRYVGVRRRPSGHRVLSVLGPLAALAVTAASATLFLTGATRAPDASQVVQLPGICSNCAGLTPTPVGTGAPRPNSRPASVGAMHTSSSWSPAASRSPIGTPAPATSTPTPSNSPLIQLPPLPPLPTSALPCPMPTKKNGKPKHGRSS